MATAANSVLMQNIAVDDDNFFITDGGEAVNNRFIVNGLSAGSGTITLPVVADNGNVTLATTGSATATDVTVADESTDTTCFPLFVTAATGDLPPKSGSNLTFNSNSGLLGSSGFTATGTVTGATLTDSTLSITGGSITNAVNITAGTTITGATLTDSTLSITGGSITNAVNITAGTTITGATLTDSTLSITGGSITNAVNITAGTTITGGTLTDSTLSITGGSITGAVNITAGSIVADNITIDNNTISSTDTNGNITLAPNGRGGTRIGNKTIFDLSTTTAGANKTAEITITTGANATYIVMVRAFKRDTTGGTNTAYFNVLRTFQKIGSGELTEVHTQITQTAGTLNGCAISLSADTSGDDNLNILLTKHGSNTGTTWEGTIEVITDDTGIALGAFP
jgi:hypothetical protein